MHAEALPEGLRRFAGRIVDVDSHEMMPVQAWIPTFGSDLQPLVDSWLAHGQSERNNLNHPNVPDYPGDVMKIDARVYDVKGSRAPGATDPFRRLEVMDALGVNRQLMFPGVSGYAMLLALLADNPNYMASVKGDRQKRREVAEHARGEEGRRALGRARVPPAGVADRNPQDRRHYRPQGRGEV